MIDNTGPAFWSAVPFGFNQALSFLTSPPWTLTDQYNATYSSVGGSSNNIRSQQGRSDKRYWECTIDASSFITTGNMEVGIFTAANGINTPTVAASNPGVGYAFSLHASGNTAFINVNNATVVASAALVGVGNTVMIAVDGATGKVWVGVDGAWQTGNPATGTAPVGTLGAGTYYVACGPDQSSGVALLQVTGRFLTGSTIFVPPAGFNCWDD